MSRAERNHDRLISILSDLFKVYERFIHNEINAFFDDTLSKFQCDYLKGYSAQH